MILYFWTALNDTEQTARSESDPNTWSESDPNTRSGGDWTAWSESDPEARSGANFGSAESPVAMGITDDRGRAMTAGEETLESGRAAVVIIEAVHPAMAGPTLAPCYVRTGVGWLGRCTNAGEVAWKRFFLRDDPDGQQVPGRIGP